MFRRIAQYPVISAPDGVRYRPRAYAEPRADGTWAGYLVYFPLVTGASVVSTTEQTIKPTFGEVATWAATVGQASLLDGLQVALSLEPSESLQSTILELQADSSALQDLADDAHVAAVAAENLAEAHDVDAAAARAEAEALHDYETRIRGEAATLAQRAAEAEADVHERVADEAPPVASDAAQTKKTRRRTGQQKRRSKS
jgi:hypothetical protein